MTSPPCHQPTPIPLPADDYDRPHTTTALLASLRCTTSAFDAVMDALLSTTAQQGERVKSLEGRVERARRWIGRLEKIMEDRNGDLKDIVCRVSYPADYDEALRGIELGLAEIRNGLSPPHNSAADSARSAADAAVRAALRRDATMDDGAAIPNDSWLDQASMGIGGLAHSLEVADAQRRVPLLYGSLVGKHAMDGSGRCMDEIEYRGILDALVRAETKANIPGTLADLALSTSFEGGRGDGDDESVHSANSRISTLSMASNVSLSGRMTAIQRRRLHQQQQQLRNIKAGGVSGFDGKDEDGAGVISTNRTASFSNQYTSKASNGNSSTSISGRQQSISGSHPYLCEVLHDSYGIGSDPPKGLTDCSGFSSRGTREGGTEFYPPPSSVSDLMVFNTSRDSYGLANRRAAALMASLAAVVPANETSIDTKKTSTKEAALPESPGSTAVKKQKGGSEIEAASSKLAKLVFIPDASAADAAAPSLDLPERLPISSAKT
ncbi:hypothetical protein HJC23_005605 [Cyclotella cryptica]|uniref:Uncharacterized protein n=1 Tax=Cyclotella cryptica TaxID=29204 RepID=A0ABD3PY33_9STRA|eukprot:CCRYP_010472-RA/>CCRYP_010472-RA protein AED:0.04 eAED:0.04 QI:0/-1/0/1/-1/1/1/0/494